MRAGAESKPQQGIVARTLRFWLPVIVLVVLVRTLLFQPFHIPSESMKPTLLVGDALFASKYPYGYSRYSLPFSPPLFSGRILGSYPRRGDIVVFALPRQFGRSHQAGDRLARRPHPDDRRPASHQRGGG